jgi:hypothetical protein
LRIILLKSPFLDEDIDYDPARLKRGIPDGTIFKNRSSVKDNWDTKTAVRPFDYQY